MTVDAVVIEKAKQDPFFASVIRLHGAEYLTQAGFFDDGAALGVDMAHCTDHDLSTTSLHKLVNRLDSCVNSAQRKAVLVTTGGFCPIHDGHLLMMESARAELERRGFLVAGGFIAPDHDMYVRGKCGAAGIPAIHRVDLVKEATMESAWLEVDPWLALYVGRSINFTDYIRRMEEYLRHHLKSKLEVFYVCGSDNAGFARAFTERAGLVIVPRAGTSCCVKLTEHSDRVILCERHAPNEISSTRIRQAQATSNIGASTICTTPATHHMTQDTKSANEIDKYYQPKDALHKISIVLRDEHDWAIRHWLDKHGSIISDLQRTFVKGLMSIFDSCFARAYPDAWLTVERIPLSLQKMVVKEFSYTSDLPTISLDSCIKGEWNIEISRIFETTSSRRLSYLVPRPGAQSLHDQIAAIPPGEYALLDDDIATGETVRLICNLLPPEIRIRQLISVHKLVTGREVKTREAGAKRELSEIADVRDFLLGARDGGLVVKLFNGKVTRAPYLLPYVRNTERMSLPAEYEHKFSLSVWHLNYEFFSKTPSPILVNECDQEFKTFATSLGFTHNTPLRELCEWHITQLSQNR